MHRAEVKAFKFKSLGALKANPIDGRWLTFYFRANASVWLEQLHPLSDGPPPANFHLIA
jgi:hypothetical protein